MKEFADTKRSIRVIQNFVKKCGSAYNAADNLGVSRQTIYTWLNGGPVRTLVLMGVERFVWEVKVGKRKLKGIN